MMAGGDDDGEGAARRRRQRRLRSWLKHERQSVAMALAEHAHHSSPGQRTARAREVEAHESHEALRGQKEPPPGARPGLLLEPAPQRSDRTVRRSSGKTPLLAVPSLAGGDGADDTAFAFLVRQTLQKREEEEEGEGEGAEGEGGEGGEV